MPSRAADAPPIPLGTVLRETYELVSVLGTGAMGTVFLARHLRLPGKQVAVKVLHGHEQLTPTQYARFRREAQISSRIVHPNIVSVLDFNDRENGTPFLVMEHLQGESLSRRLKRGRPPMGEALSIARQIGSALQAAHQVGIVHRDLKPDNIYLLTSDAAEGTGPRVKLLDFGISKIVTSQSIQTRDDVLLGTPRYMSPEQATGQNSTIDARSDQFSLGSIVYQMLCGEPPFGGTTVSDILYRIVYDPPAPVTQRCPEASPALRSALERALAKDPEDRFPDVAAFITQLTGVPLVVPPPAPAPPQAPPPSEAATISAAPTLANTLSAAPTLSAASTLANTLQVPAPARSGNPRLLGRVAVALLVTAATGWALLRSSAAPEAAPASAPVQAALPSTPERSAPRPPDGTGAPAPEASARAEVPPAPPAASTPVPSAPVAEQGTTSPALATAQATPGKRPPTRQTPSESMPEAVRQDLEEARRALEAGNTEKAIQLLRRSQRTQVTGASFALLTQAHCRDRDLSNARPQWFRVPASDKARVRQYCKRYDIEF